VYGHWGWSGVCTLGAALGAMAAAVWAWESSHRP
jgi:hypothetical protein